MQCDDYASCAVDCHKAFHETSDEVEATLVEGHTLNGWRVGAHHSWLVEGGAFCEPLSVGVYACEQKVQVKEGDAIAIFGAGPIGTICSLVANGMGAKKVILVDIAQKKESGARRGTFRRSLPIHYT
eukprot:gene2386-biopygen38808